jgi:hypothetical protein
MSELKFSCPHCGQHILCDEQLAGREIQCPSCPQVLQIPATAGKNYPAPAEPPPASRAPPPLAVHQPPPRNDRQGLRTGWKISPAIPAGLAVVVTGLFLFWSARGHWQSHSDEAAMRRKQSEINAKRQQAWKEFEKQMAQSEARFKQKNELRLQRGLERNQQRQDQSLRRIKRETELSRERAELTVKSRQLPRNSSEYRAAINRLRAVEAEQNTLAKETAAEFREMELSLEVMDLETKLFNMSRKSSEYQATSDRLQALRTQLRKLGGEAAELSPAEMVAASSNASRSDFTKQLDALAVAEAKLDQTEGKPLSQRTRGKRYKTTLTAGAAFLASVAYFVGTLRYRRKHE